MANFSRSIPKVGDGPLVAPFSAAATPDLDAELQLAGTVPHYERHVFLCYKGPHAWPTKTEDSNTAGLPGRLAAAIEARQALKTTKFTICEGEDGSEFSNGDILVFPDMVQYKGLTCSYVNDFVEEVLVNGFVLPCVVRQLLQTHIGQRKIMEKLWRGQMGLSQEEQLEALMVRNIKNARLSYLPGEKLDESFVMDQKQMCSGIENVSSKKGPTTICQKLKGLETRERAYAAVALAIAAAVVFSASRFYKDS